MNIQFGMNIDFASNEQNFTIFLVVYNRTFFIEIDSHP